jgi:hypothetical protein
MCACGRYTPELLNRIQESSMSSDDKVAVRNSLLELSDLVHAMERGEIVPVEKALAVAR